MSGESALRATPSVNIEEFERRLRATGSLGAAHDDPLAELARLLGAEEPPPAAPAEAPPVLSEPEPQPTPAATPASAAAPPPAAPAAAPTPPPLRAAPRVDSSLGRVVNVDFGSHTQPAPAAAPEPPPLLVEPPPFLETPAEPPPLLRAPSAARLADEARPRGKVWPVAALVVIGVAAGAGAWAYRGGVPGLVAKTPPLIMAAAGPTKVQPPSQDTVSSPNDIASMIAKDQTSRPAAGNVVSNEEQPVDLNERAKAQAAADARAAAPPANPPTIAAAPLVVVSAPSPTAPSAPTPALTNAPAAPAPIPAADAPPPASANAPSPANSAPPARSLVVASSPSPVAPADSMAITPGGGTVGPTAAPAAPPTPFPEPKRVKTVSVRPDGSFIAAPPQQDQTASVSQPGASQALEPPTLPVDPPVPVPRPAIDPSSAEPATPKLDLPTKLSGKTTTRVPIAKIDTTAATTGQSPEAPLPVAAAAQETKPKRHEPVHVAVADPPPAAPAPDSASAAAAAPSQEEKPSGPASFFAALGDAARGLAGHGQDTSAPAAPTPTRTASAAPQASAPTPADSGGNYAVQLAAPGSEAEAQSVASRLQSKYAAELGGLQPAIHKAALKDKTVYRVRVQRLTHSEAVSLCEKLKAAGGACFLARE